MHRKQYVNKRAKKTTKRSRPLSTTQNRETRATLVREPTRVVADTTIARLRYTDLSLSRLNAAGAQFSIFQIRINDAYDPDPLLGSGSISGFYEWSAFYARYRVLNITVKWNLGNFTTVPIMAYYYAAPNISPVPLSVSGAIDMAEVSQAVQVRMLAPAASTPNIVIFPQKTYELATVLGSRKEYFADLDYTGVATTTPTGPVTRMYLTFVAYSPNVWAASLVSNLVIDFEIEFFGRQPVVG